jgi:hypothetical protein
MAPAVGATNNIWPAENSVRERFQWSFLLLGLNGKQSVKRHAEPKNTVLVIFYDGAKFTRWVEYSESLMRVMDAILETQALKVGAGS